MIVAENGHQKVLEIGQKITTLGRSHENTVEIDDISSSRLHCQIERKEGGATRLLTSRVAMARWSTESLFFARN